MYRHCFKHFTYIKYTNISGDLGASLRPVTNWAWGDTARRTGRELDLEGMMTGYAI